MKVILKGPPFSPEEGHHHVSQKEEQHPEDLRLEGDPEGAFRDREQIRNQDQDIKNIIVRIHAPEEKEARNEEQV
ncbi:MAG: hypothetical protein ABFD70_08935 [Syntrophaceae bacterium]|nr:hypothetical protein [Deltaproteobacteria bacterium]